MISFPVFQISLLVLLAVAVVVPLPGCWRICQRAGWSGWLSLVIVIPIVNAIAIYWLALSRPGRLPVQLSQSRNAASAFHMPARH